MLINYVCIFIYLIVFSYYFLISSSSSISWCFVSTVRTMINWLKMLFFPWLI